jgi:copper(I)-binding protein
LEVLIRDEGHRDIQIVGVASPLVQRAMLHYDVNMCSGTHIMLAVPAVTLGRGQTLKLGLKGNGAMLVGAARALAPHEHVTINIRWTRGRGAIYSSTFVATVVKRPEGLRLSSSMASMGM